jgi:selenocysteine lyase/cysteine desulfurase
VPTFAFRVQGLAPRRIAEQLDEAGIYVTEGNYYALAVTEHLGLEDKGGMVRAGMVHYNTLQELDRLESALHGLV